MSDSIEIKIEGPRVTPAAFKKAIDAFFGLVEGVARNITGRPDAVAWTVEVARGSAVVRMKRFPDQEAHSTTDAARTIDALSRGMRSLQSGLVHTPAGFQKDEVRAARMLASIADGTAIQSIWIKNGGAPDRLLSSLIQTADAILAGDKSIAYGSIEGKIGSLAVEELTDREAFTCSINEPNYGRSVACSFSKRDLEEKAVKAFRKRVLVSGMVRYGKEGYPTSIVADQFREFPEESELPTVEEIQAIYREIYK